MRRTSCALLKKNMLFLGFLFVLFLIPLQAHAAVDLSMDSWNSPGSANGFRSRISIQFKVKNSGTTAAGKFTVTFYYGDSTSASGLTTLGNVTINSLNARSSTNTLSTSVTLPNNVLYGQRYIHYYIDSGRSITESNEGNNRNRRPFLITGQPNLRITYLTTYPRTQAANGTLTLYYRIYNYGYSRATRFTTRFYYSANSTYQTSDPYLRREITTNSLPALSYFPATANGTTTVQLPSNVTSGTRYILGFVDYNNAIAENNDSDNVYARSLTITNGAPNLRMSSWGAPSSIRGAQSRLTFTFRVQNNGSGDAGTFYVAFYYSDRNKPSLTYLGNHYIASLKKGTTTNTLTRVVTLPNTVLFGTQSLHYFIDYSNRLNEMSELDNRGTRSINITGRPNIQISYLTRTPSTQVRSGELIVSYRIYNEGYSRIPNAFDSRFYYSPDRTLTTTDTYLQKQVTISSLYARSISAGTVTVTLPANAQPGTRYVGIVADHDKKLTETNENDNAFSTAFTVTSGMPDLEVPSWNATSSAQGANSRVTVTYTIRNKGSLAAGSFDIAFYYGDTSGNSGLVYLGKQNINGLAAGKSTATLTNQLTLPGTVLSGSRFLHYYIDYTNRVAEISESNNRGSRGISITGKPNLQVTYLLATPTNQVKSGYLTILYRVYNSGYTRTNRNFYLYYYYSTDSTITTRDVYVGRTLLPVLAGRTNQPSSGYGRVVVRVPSNAATGRRYIGAIVDNFNWIPESNEKDNIRAAAFNVTTSASELLMASWTADSRTPGYNNKVNVTFSIRNSGNVDTRDFYVYFYYSDSTNPTGSTYLGRTYITKVSKNSTVSNQKITLTMPRNVLLGRRYLHYLIDATNRVNEVNELNNRGYRTLDITGLPNLVVSYLTRSPSTQVKGGQITIGYRITNTGLSRISTAAATRFYYSTDSSIRTSDTYLQKEVSTASLLAGVSASGNVQATIPSNATNGTRYIGAITDYNSRVRESRDSDNTRAVSIVISSTNADLDMQTWTVPSSTLGAGSKMNLRFTIRNKGTAKTGTFVTYFYYSDQASTSGRRYLGSYTVTALNAGATHSGTKEVTLPGNVLYGQRYISYHIDATNRIGEVTEANNVGYKAFSVTSRPNLQVSVLSVTPASQIKGGQVTVKYRLFNAGYSRVTSTIRTRLYYSTDSTITTSDVYLRRDIAIRGMDARTSYPSLTDGTTTIQLPTNAVQGTRYIGAIIDYNKAIPESIDTDNTRAAAITVIDKIADLVMNTFTAPPTAPGAGTKVTLTFKLQNRGSQDAGAFDVAFYYGASTSRSGLTFLGRQSITGIPKSSIDGQRTFVVTLPKSVTAGRRYLHYHIDYLNKISESTKVNNYGVRSITITGKPNIQVAFLGLQPTSQVPRGQIIVYYRIRNTGNTRANGFYLRLYFSTDTTYDSKDTYLGRTLYIPFVDAGNSYPTTANGNITVSVPSTAKKGTSYILAFADYSNRVAESDEKDNVRAAAFNIVTNISDLYMSLFTMNSSAGGSGDTLTVLYNVANRGSADASKFSVAFYYGDSTSTSKLRYLGQAQVKGLAKGKNTSVLGFTVKLPADVLTGRRYIHYHIDHINEVAESVETNNRGYSPILLTGKANLQVSALSITPKVQAAGHTLILSYQIKNTGKARADGFYLRFYYSADATITNQDQPLRDIFIPSIIAGATHPKTGNASVNLSVPKNAKLGTRYIGVIADARVQVDESNEKDNTKAVGFTVATAKPDLAVLSFTTSQKQQQLGKVVKIFFEINNRGSQDTPSTTVTLYHSTNALISTLDTPLKSFTFSLKVGQSYKQTFDLTLPKTLPSGNGFLGIIADPGQKLSESDESNNIASQPILLLADKDGDGVTSDKDCNDNDKTVYPGAKELCDGKDNNCDKRVDEGCLCVDKDKRPCFTGNTGCTQQGSTFKCTAPCKAGTQTCDGKKGWGACIGEVTASQEICDGKDNNCDGKVDENLAKACYTGPAGTSGKGECKDGLQQCQNGKWTQCTGEIVPTKELCDNKDNDCDGQLDNQKNKPDPIEQSCSNPCGQGQERCINGKWQNCTAPPTCSEATENPDAGEPTPETPRDADCYSQGCPAGQLCQAGKCAADPCDNVNCQKGQFCRQGQCVDACGCKTCPAGEQCQDGQCQKDLCAGSNCKSDEICDTKTGKCISDPCASVTCGKGRLCQGGQCVDDPCLGIKCPTDQMCQNGQCIGQQCNSEGTEETTPEVTPTEQTGETPSDTVEATPEETEPDTTPDATQPADNGASDGKEQTTPGPDNAGSDGQVEPPPGCGCSATPGSPNGALLVLFVLLFFMFARKKNIAE